MIPGFVLIVLLLALTNKFSSYTVISLAGFLFSFVTRDGIILFKAILLKGTVITGTIIGCKSYGESERAVVHYVSHTGEEYSGEAAITFAPGTNPDKNPVSLVIGIFYNPDRPKQFVSFSDGVTKLANYSRGHCTDWFGDCAL